MGEGEGFGGRLRALRQARSLTQETLAERAGLSIVTISQLERGATDPRLSTIERLAAALEVPPPELLVAATDGSAWVAVGPILLDAVRRAARSDRKEQQLLDRLIRAALA